MTAPSSGSSRCRSRCGCYEPRLDAAGGDNAEVIAAADEAAAELKLAIQELRELARGIHPAILTEAGLGPAITALADRSTVPATVGALPDRRLSPAVEATAYFVVSEALANVAKYASATQRECRRRLPRLEAPRRGRRQRRRRRRCVARLRHPRAAGSRRRARWPDHDREPARPGDARRRGHPARLTAGRDRPAPARLLRANPRAESGCLRATVGIAPMSDRPCRAHVCPHRVIRRIARQKGRTAMNGQDETTSQETTVKRSCRQEGCTCQGARIVSLRRAAFFAVVARKNGETADRQIAPRPDGASPPTRRPPTSRPPTDRPRRRSQPATRNTRTFQATPVLPGRRFQFRPNDDAVGSGLALPRCRGGPDGAARRPIARWAGNGPSVTAQEQPDDQCHHDDRPHEALQGCRGTHRPDPRRPGRDRLRLPRPERRRQVDRPQGPRRPGPGHRWQRDHRRRAGVGRRASIAASSATSPRTRVSTAG